MVRPADESARLAELRSYRILDTPPDPTFDRLTVLAARLCAAPIAVVTLVDEGRQWFKSRVGIDATETDRAIAFCAHAIERTEPMRVPDALADIRFATNPFVVAEPKIRSYHGVPLINPRGFALGTLAVLDHVPRELDELQAEALEVLAEQVVVQLEQHRHHHRQVEVAAELERLNAELGDAAQRYDELYRTNPLPMWISDVETLRFLDVNDATVAMYGWDRDEFAAMTIDDIRPPEDVEHFRALLAEVHDDHFYEMGPVRHRRADGTVFPVMVGAHRTTYQGRAARLVLVRDVSEVEVAERRVAEAAGLLVERLTAIVEVWRELSDDDPTLDELYDAMPGLALRVLGAGGAALFLVDGRHLEPRSLAGYLTTAPRLPVEGSLAGWVVRQRRATRTADFTVDARAGIATNRTDRSRSLVLAPVDGSRGTIGVLVVHDRAVDHFDDADERSLDLLARALGAMVRRLEAESARRSTEEQALQSQRLEAIGQLTGGVAHDFNNLLTVILGNVDQLIAEIDDRPALLGFAEMTRDAALRGAELSHRLLAFARRQALEPEPVDANALLAHLDGLLRRTLPENVELDLVRAPDLWPAFVDHGQLENALLNLCLNARDAMPDGGRIRIETANASVAAAGPTGGRDDEVAPGDYVVITVCDTGVGIPDDIVDRVIEPFFTTKAHGVGSGLGLSMVHGFVTQSGGFLEIESGERSGTTLRLHLPRSSTAPADDRAGERHAPVDRGSERILLVEDDDLVRQLSTRHLRRLGYDVIAAASGPDALELLRSRGPVDLLFTDVVMPGGMGGHDLALAALEVQPDLRVLYTSGYTDDAIVHHGRVDPGVQLLGKPYRLAELARKVRDVLDAPTG